MFGKFEVVHLIGSTKGSHKIFRNTEEQLTKLNYIVFKPVFYDIKDCDPIKEILNDMCYEKLLVCDIVCIVTPEHIGDSTTMRIHQAIELGKKVMIWKDGKMIPFTV